MRRQVERHAHELPLGLHPVQTAHAELAKSQHALDPAIGRFCNPFAPTVSLARFGGLHLLHHRRSQRQGGGVDRAMALAFTADRDDQLGVLVQRLEDRFAAVARIGQGLVGVRAEHILHCLDHLGQLVHIRRVVDQLGRHDDVGRVVDGGLRVVGGIETTACAGARVRR